METEKYDLVFTGQILPGQELGQVKSNIQGLFRIDAGKVEALFSGKSVVLKRGLDPDTANKYRVAIKKAGAMVNVVLAEPTQTKPQSQSDVGDSSRNTSQSKAPAVKPAEAKTEPNRGASKEPSSEVSTSVGAQPLVQPQPRQPIVAPEFSVAAAGADLVAESERVKVEPVQVNISGITVAENTGNLIDESEIVRPQPTQVDIPDVDIAPVGSDVLKPEERAKVVPVDVDTSKLSVDNIGERLSAPSPKAPPAPNVDHIKFADE